MKAGRQGQAIGLGGLLPMKEGRRRREERDECHRECSGHVFSPPISPAVKP